MVADLNKQGYVAFLAGAGLSYDVVVEIESKLYKVQVKSTAAPRRLNDTYRNPSYLFRIDKKHKKEKKYQKSDYDLLALVAVDIGAVAYLTFDQAENKAAIQLRASKKSNPWTKKQKCIHDHPLSEAIKSL